jgi:hypothetical protein
LTSVTDEPLFWSLDAALRFAYTIEWYPAYPVSMLGKLLKGLIRFTPDMDTAAWHAQAAMIQGHCKHHLQRYELAWVECWYRHGPGRFEHRHVIVDTILPQVAGSAAVVKRHMIRELVAMHFEAKHKTTYAAIARKLGCDARTVEKFDQRVRPAIEGIAKRTEEILDTDFRAGGLIP